MARLVEDSDDELPELAVVISKHGRGAELNATGKNRAMISYGKAAENKTVVKPTAGPKSAGSQASSGDLRGSAMDDTNPKSKRRVLKKIYDCPLLRPINEQKDSTQPLATSQRSKLQSEVLLMRLKEHTESKASGQSDMSSISADTEAYLQDSTELSDLFVNDSSSLEESTDEEIQSHQPRSTRRLVKGRKSPGLDTSQEVHLRPIDANQPQMDQNSLPLNCKSFRRGDDGEDMPRMSNNDLPEVIPRGRCAVTPPPSPQKPQKRLLSPKKGPRIPMTPHRPSMDAFWDPDVINEWNEEYSPRKTPRPQYCMGDDGLEVCLPPSPSKKSNLVRDAKKREAKKAFTEKKHDIAEAFLRELDETIADGKVSEMATLTGGIQIIWSKKLKTTAGRANWKRETMRSTTRGETDRPETNVTHRHHASIELAEKVIDDEERLLNVIAHEFCHLANFMVSGITNNPHGKEFKAWAARCSHHFGDRGIHVTTKHSYDIDYKYVWECTNCGTEFKRHSKSIDPLKHQCGSCKSKLVQTKPVPRANAVASQYQLFVKENMGRVKEQNPGSPQKQIMTLVGKMYQEHKALKLGSVGEKLDAAGEGNADGVGLKEEPADGSQLDLVMRKLNFLDLTSP